MREVEITVYRADNGYQVVVDRYMKDGVTRHNCATLAEAATWVAGEIAAPPKKRTK